MTLAELKRKLQVGTKFKMTKNACSERRIGKIREVKAIQSNGIVVGEPGTEERSFLEFPPASLIEADEKGFRFYQIGLRPMTDREKEIVDGEPVDPVQEERDMLSDGSTMFYRRKVYYHNLDADYLYFPKNRGAYAMRLDHNTRQIKDPKVKGKIDLEYEFIKE